MCIGLPMQVIENRSGYAICEGMGVRRRIDTMLVGAQPEGTWLLTFLNTAREVLTPEQAQRTTDALQALNLAMEGETSLGHLFADLVDREPELPEFLRQSEINTATGD